MATRTSDVQSSFSGGLNTVSNPVALRPDQAQTLTNYKLTTVGAAVKRQGTQKPMSSGTVPIGGGFFWLSQRKNVIFGGTSIYLSSSSSFPVAFSGAAMPGAFTVSDCVPFVGPDGAEWLYGVAQGLTQMYRYQGGASMTTAGSAFTVPIDALVVYNNRLWGWIANPTAESNALFYSALNNGDTLANGSQSGGQINVTTFGTVPIRTCYVVGASLMIFHDRGLSRLTGWGQDDISVSPQAVSESISVLSRRSVTGSGDIAFALTTDGLYRVTEGGVAPVATPDKPDPTVPIIKNATALTNYAGCVYNATTKEVWCTIFTTGASTSEVYIYNTLIDSWSGPFNGPYASLGATSYGVTMWRTFDVARAANGSYVEQLWFSNASGTLYYADAPYYTDGVASDGTAGTAYTSVLKTRRMGTQTLMMDKSQRWVTVDADITTGSTVTVATTTNTGTDTQNLTPTTGQRNYYVQASGIGPWVDVTITDSGTVASSVSAVSVDGFLLPRR